MTGFGKTTVEFRNKKIIIEIKSLNSKQLDLNLRIPNLYKEKEMEIRGLVKERLDHSKKMVFFGKNGKEIKLWGSEDLVLLLRKH